MASLELFIKLWWCY